MDVGGTGAGRSSWRGLIFVFLFAAGCLVPINSATAATLTSSSGYVNYDAAAGETNQLTVVRSGVNYVFTESGAVAIAAAAPCSNLLASVAVCPAAGINSLNLSLGDMNDQASYDASIGKPPLDIYIDGGLGNDDMSGTGETPAQMLGREGNDTLTGSNGGDDLRAGEGNDVVEAGPGNDGISDGPGADLMAAGPGRDRLNASSEADPGDILDGGAGLDDSIDLRGRSGDMTVDFDGVADDGEAGEADNLTGFEQFESGSGDDLITGGPSPNSIYAGEGDDTVDGGPGPDYLDGDRGNDQIEGGPGNDVIDGGRGGDRMAGGDGEDEFRGEMFDDGADVYSGGDGTDSIGAVGDYFGRGVKVTLDGIADDGPIEPVAGTPADNAGADIENLTVDETGSSQGEGGEYSTDDILTGNAAANQIDGGSGNDQINGLGGPDALLGGIGDDVLDGGTGIDYLEGSGGSDQIRSRDTDPDEVSCGSSADTLLADRFDDFTVTCDSSSTGAELQTGSARLRKKKKALVRVSCPAAEGIACQVKIVARKGKKTLAKGSGKVASGKTSKVTLKLTKAGKKARGRKLKLKATTTMTDAAGAVVTTLAPGLVLRR